MALGALTDATRVHGRPSNGLFHPSTLTEPKHETKLAKFLHAVSSLASKPVLVACAIAFVVGGLAGTLLGMSSRLFWSVPVNAPPTGFLASAEMSRQALARLEDNQERASLVLARVEEMGRTLERLERELRTSSSSKQNSRPPWDFLASEDQIVAASAAVPPKEDHVVSAVSHDESTLFGAKTSPRDDLDHEEEELFSYSVASTGSARTASLSREWAETAAGEARARFAKAAKDLDAKDRAAVAEQRAKEEQQRANKSGDSRRTKFYMYPLLGKKGAGFFRDDAKYYLAFDALPFPQISSRVAPSEKAALAFATAGEALASRGDYRSFSISQPYFIPIADKRDRLQAHDLSFSTVVCSLDRPRMVPRFELWDDDRVWGSRSATQLDRTKSD